MHYYKELENLKMILIYFVYYVCICVCLHGGAGAGCKCRWLQGPAESIEPRELELQGVVNHLTWVLRLGSLGKQQAPLTAEPCLNP